MLIGLTFFAIFYGPTILISVIALAWARDSVVPKLSKVLRISAWIALIGLGVIYILCAVALGTCSGNFLYGFGRCHFMSKETADFIAWLGLLTTFYGAIYAALLFAIGAIIEARARR